MKKYGIVLVGCGTVAGYGHLPAIVKNKRLILKGVVDVIPEKAKKYAKEFNAESWSIDYRDYLKRKDINIVVVTTIPSTHAKIIIDSLKAEKHVLSEKPITSNIEDAYKILEAVKKTRKKLLVGYIQRNNRAYQAAQEIISKGEIGFPLIMRMQGAEYYEINGKCGIIKEGQWNRALRLLKDTSPLIDCGVHYVDMMRWVTDSEPVYVSGVGTRINTDVPKNNYDYGAILIKFKDGSTGIYEVGWGYTMIGFQIKEFIGPKGNLKIVYKTIKEGKETIMQVELFTINKGAKTISIKGSIKPFDLQTDKLIKYIEDDIDCVPGLIDAIKSLQIVLAGDKAIKTGKIQYL